MYSTRTKLDSGRGNQDGNCHIQSRYATAGDNFFRKCFAAVRIPYSPKDRHIDIADVDRHYMKNGCFWCLIDNDNIIGTIAIRILDDVNGVVELKRMFVLPEYQGNGCGRMLLEYAIKYAQDQHYKKMCLDTRKQFSVAQHLYRSVDMLREILW